MELNNFYPRSPCGERHNINNSVSTADKISIHALLAESDILPMERLTGLLKISIHALLAESDLAIHTKSREYATFLSTLSLRRATYPLR